MKHGENWTGKGPRRSLAIDRRQGTKKFLVVPIDSRLEAKRPESVIGSMPELAEIVLENFPR